MAVQKVLAEDDYRRPIMARICTMLIEGFAMKVIAVEEGMPSIPTIYNWMKEFPEFMEDYLAAKAVQAELMADELLKIADDGSNDTYTDEEGEVKTNFDVIARSKLRVDARKFLMEKQAPRRFGQKVSSEISGPNGGPVKTVGASITTSVDVKDPAELARVYQDLMG